jgi:hypothetical protein
MIDVLRSGFADPPVTAVPIMRWWWFGPSVDRDELSRELTAMAGAGFGGSRWPTSTRWGQRPLISCPTPFLPTCAAADRVYELDLRFDLTFGAAGPSVGRTLPTSWLRAICIGSGASSRPDHWKFQSSRHGRNTAANALATEQHIIELVAQSEARYGRRFRMQDLDRAMASVRSGLLSAPAIVLSTSGAQN